MDGESKGWSLEFGLYPGILFGFRSYEDEEKSIMCYTYLLWI